MKDKQTSCKPLEIDNATLDHTNQYNTQGDAVSEFLFCVHGQEGRVLVATQFESSTLARGDWSCLDRLGAILHVR